MVDDSTTLDVISINNGFVCTHLIDVIVLYMSLSTIIIDVGLFVKGNFFAPLII